MLARLSFGSGQASHTKYALAVDDEELELLEDSEGRQPQSSKGGDGRWYMPWSRRGSKGGSRGPGAARAVIPQELSYTLPSGHKPGDTVTIQGPLGPLQVRVPEGKTPGDLCTHVLGPGPDQVSVVDVPEGVTAGEVVEFTDGQGRRVLAQVPAGKLPGDTFEAAPPVMMVEVPEGGRANDRLSFQDQEGKLCTALVPKGVPPGHFFPACTS